MLIQNLHVEHVGNADNLDIVMLMYNLIEYCSDTSGSLWQFKRDEQNMNNGNPVNVTTDGSSFFKCKSSFKNQLLLIEIEYLKM